MKFNNIILNEALKPVHYNGWFYIIESIKDDIYDENSDIALDSFSDSCFWNKQKQNIYSKWVGILHAVVNSNPFNQQILCNFLKHPWFLNNKNNCVALITLSKHTANSLRNLTNIPVFNTYHPKTCTKFFDIKKYFKNPIINHSGFHDRNIRKFATFKTRIKKQIYLDKPWHEKYIYNYLENEYHDIELKNYFFQNDEYISNFVSHIGFSYYNDAAASNALLEHIVSYTPIIVNKIPAVVEYIGENYPMFYEEIKHNPDYYLLSEEYVKQCSSYLKERSKLDIFSIEKFKQDILSF